ncbi:MAG: 4-phosphoerythronate dehydrogenase [Gammaproteobacteria bacterium]|nr:4-phosphoerythronate dehydrogenase [Gammaproteobacteria bacterium]
MPMVDELFGDFCWIERKAGRDIGAKDLADVDILLVRSITQVNRQLLESSPVKFVGTATIGTDHIDKDYLAASNIEFADAAGCNAQAVAEYVIAAIGYWAYQRDIDLHSKKVGVIGAGNVGTKVSRMLDLLGIQYLLNDPILEANGDKRDFSPLGQINQCDIVTCHVPLTKSGDYPTHHLLDAKFLKVMPKDSLLINSARGSVLDNQAALEFLSNNASMDMVLDVWEGEPSLNVDLFDKCLLGTPHIAGYSLEGKIRGTYFLYQAVRKWLGKETSYQLQKFLPQTKLWQKPRNIDDLHDSLKPFYDIKEDDMALRQVAVKTNQNLPQDFDLLRKNYKNRLEYYR